MKTTISALIILAALLAFSSKNNNSGNATVQRMQGIDIYVMSEPTRPYEVIKSIETFIWSNCKESINTPVNRASKTEGAQGVIIYFPTTGKYSIIKYKD